VVALAVACKPHRTPTFAFRYVEQRGRVDRNGMRFVIMPDASAKLVEVAMRYEVGAADDPVGKAGLAHLVEHLMFQLRPQGQSLASVLSQLTARYNAYTDYDSTHYMALARDSQFDILAQVEAVRLRHDCTSIPEQEFLREREVVRNELRQRYGTPDGQIEPQTLAGVFPPNHPYGRMVGGTDAELASITLADVCAFMDQYYVPERATLILAGNITSQQGVAAVQQWFASIDRKAGAPRRRIEATTLKPSRRTIKLDIERPIVAASWTLPAQHGVWDDALLDEIFDRLRRVSSAAREYEFGTRVMPTVLGGRMIPVVTVFVELENMNKVDEALAFVRKAASYDKRAWDKSTWAVPEHVKGRFMASYVMDLESLDARARKVADLIQFTRDHEFLSKEPFLFHALDAIRKLDIDEVGDTAKRVLDGNQMHVTIFEPVREGLRGDARASFVFATPQTHDRGEKSVDPEEARHRLKIESEQYAIARAKRFTLDNGLRVVLLPLDSPLPLVTAELVFHSGDAAAPDSPHLAAAAARFVQPPPEMLRRLIRAGIYIPCRTTMDDTRCTARGVSIYLPEIIEGLERMTKMGVYEQRSIERWQHVTGSMNKRRRELAQQETDRQLDVALYGADHPYTRAGTKTAGSERRIGRDQLHAFRKAHYTAANGTLIVVGAFDFGEAESLIRKAFGDWSRGSAHAPVTAAATRTNTVVGVVRDPGPQLELRIAYPSPGGVGGQQAARLVVAELIRQQGADIRERLGATYGVYVSRDERLGPTRYELRTTVDAPRAGEAIKALRDGIAALRDGSDFDVRFVRARRKVLQRLLGESAVTQELAQRLATIARFELAPDYYATLQQQVAALSPAQVKAVIAAELDPAAEALVAAADRDTLNTAFAAAGLTDVKMIEPPKGK
jgi:zinc protease